MCCQLLGLKTWFYFLRYEGLLLEKGILEQKYHAFPVFTGHWNDEAVLCRGQFGCTRLFHNLKSLPGQLFAAYGEGRNHFFWSQCCLVAGHTGGLESLSYEKKSFSSCTPISLIHIHFLEFILKPSYTWEHQLRLSFLRSRIQK